MIDMAFDEKDKDSFITDYVVEDKVIKLIYASGRVSDVNFSEHNLEFVRHLVEEQVNKFIDPFLDFVAKESFFTYVKRVIGIIIGLFGFYIDYNVDIHIIMKIVMALLILLGEIGLYIYHEVILGALSVSLDQVYALDFYIKNKKLFTYVDDSGENKTYLHIEDIWQKGLALEDLKNISNEVELLKKSEPFSDLELTYYASSENEERNVGLRYTKKKK